MRRVLEVSIPAATNDETHRAARCRRPWGSVTPRGHPHATGVGRRGVRTCQRMPTTPPPLTDVVLIELMLMAEPPERDVLLAATGWATRLAGDLLVAGGRSGGGCNVQKLLPPTLDDVHERSAWSGVLRVERAAAARKVDAKRSDLHILNLEAVDAAIRLASAARQRCSCRSGYETLMRVVRGAARRQVMALMDEHGQIDRYRVDESVAAAIARADEDLADTLTARARMHTSRWMRATVLSRPVVDRSVADLAAALRAAGCAAEPPRTAVREVHAGVEVTLRVPLELLARVDEAAAAARGRVLRGDIIRSVLRDGLGG